MLNLPTNRVCKWISDIAVKTARQNIVNQSETAMAETTILTINYLLQYIQLHVLKPGVHTNDFAPIHRLRALKLGHASLATVFRPGRLSLQPILRENLESPVLRYQPITTAVVTDACLNTRWHHGAYTSAVLRESLGLDRVVTVYAELSRPDWLATVQSGRKQVQSRVCTPSLRRETRRKNSH